MSNQKRDFFKTYRPKISKDLIPSSAKDPALIEKKQSQVVEAACKLFLKNGFSGQVCVK